MKRTCSEGGSGNTGVTHRLDYRLDLWPAGGSAAGTANTDGTVFGQRAALGARLAASGGRLNGGEIRSLLSGHTARINRQRGGATIILRLSFATGGGFSHDCNIRLASVRAQTHRNPQCRAPQARGTWSVRGNRLCIKSRRNRCDFVVRRGGGYIFRAASGDGRPYGGRVTVR